MTPIDRSPPTTPADDRAEADDGFLARWSRRKREVARTEAPPSAIEPATEDGQEITAPEATPDTLSEEELAALPRVDELTETSDLAPFLKRGVPLDIKNAALRKIWMLTPAIRDYRDPAVDYAWDWNTPGGVPGDGCAPSAEATARMLKDLMTPRAETPDPAVETTADTPDAPTSVAAEPASAPTNAVMAPNDVTSNTSQLAQTAEAADEPIPATSSAALPTRLGSLEATIDKDRAADVAARVSVRKRHGGAFPG